MSHPKLHEVLEARSLVDLLRRRAEEQADDLAYIFLLNGEDREARRTFGELDRHARTLGAVVQRERLAGERVLLVYPQGIEYLTAFFGAIYGGAVAVPTWPPDPERIARTLPRLQAVAQDAQISAVFTTGAILRAKKQSNVAAAGLDHVPWIATDEMDQGLADRWVHPGCNRGDVAYIQYTSGSTSTPKGVVISHEALLQTAWALDRSLEHSAGTVMVSWLPIFHDLGLIYGALETVALGFPAVLMSPAHFIQKPVRWLRAISKYRGTHSCSPNFGYALCARKITEGEKQGLDLSSWKMAMNAAEPVRKETQDAFNEAFAFVGWRPRAFNPCYGLAEATLRASSPPLAEESKFAYLDPAALEQGRAVPIPAERAGGRSVARCGTVEQDSLVNAEVLAVDPETRLRLADGWVGELWLTSSAMPLGYFNRPRETEETFGARLATGEGPYLRTGDLGFVLDGGIYVTGRRKDLIILRGQNRYPQDIEWTVESSHAAIRPSCSAAFSVEAEGEERLVVVAEVDPRRATDLREVFAAVSLAVFEAHEIQVFAFSALQPGTVHKTSSGKIQRQSCKAAWLRGELEKIDEWRLPIAPRHEHDEGAELRARVEAAADDERRDIVVAFVRAQVARLLGGDAEAIAASAPLHEAGLDSVTAVELAEEVGTAIGKNLPARFVFSYSTIDAIVSFVLGELSLAPHPDAAPASATRSKQP